MHERHQMPQPQRFKAATDIVLDGLHIVNSDRLNLGEFGDGIGVELGHDSTQTGLLLIGERREPGKNGMLAQVYELFDFHMDAVAVQCGFGEIVR